MNLNYIQSCTPLGAAPVQCHVTSLRASQCVSVYQADSLMESFLGASPSINQSPAPVSPSISCPCTARQLESHDLRGPQCSDLCDISSSHSSESRSPLAPAREMTGGGIYTAAITGSLARWMTTAAEWFIPRLCRAMPSCDLHCFLVYSSALSSQRKKNKNKKAKLPGAESRASPTCRHNYF